MISTSQCGMVMLILLSSFATISKMRGTKRRCLKQIGNCSITNECFLDLRRKNHKYIKECSKLTIKPRKSYFFDEHLSFAVAPSTAQNFPENRTHSVYLSDDVYGRNPKLVPGCCNLDEGDKCFMPGTENKTKTFFVIFPFSKDCMKRKEKIYCYYRVYYRDAPTELCEDDREIIDKCLAYENGEFWVKYRYDPLDSKPSQTLNPDRCYFLLSTLTAQKHWKKPSNSSVMLNANYIASTERSGSFVQLGNTTVKCRYKKHVNGFQHQSISKELSNSATGDFRICFAYKYSNLVRGVLCDPKIIVTRLTTPVWLSWHIAVLVTAVVVVVISIALMGMCREYRRNSTPNPETMTMKNSESSMPTMAEYTKEEEDFDPVTFEEYNEDDDQGTSTVRHDADGESATLLDERFYVPKSQSDAYIPKIRSNANNPDDNIADCHTQMREDSSRSEATTSEDGNDDGGHQTNALHENVDVSDAALARPIYLRKGELRGEYIPGIRPNSEGRWGYRAQNKCEDVLRSKAEITSDKIGSGEYDGYIPKHNTIVTSLEIQSKPSCDVVQVTEGDFTQTSKDSPRHEDSRTFIETLNGHSGEGQDTMGLHNHQDTVTHSGKIEKLLLDNICDGYIPKYITNSHGVVLAKV